MGQLRARFAAVLKERNRLAREMHDTLIQGCVGVSALLEAHSSLGEPEAGSGKDLLEFARTQLRSTIDEARKAVWNLRQAAPSEIGPQLERMADQISEEFRVPIDCRVSGKQFAFDQSTLHDVLMVAGEALYNALRHGHPENVELVAEFDDDRCILRVKDDGRGFDPQALSASPNGHYGLIGIRERVERVGGKFSVHSRVGAGTELVMEVPRTAAAPKGELTEMKL
jgi:signal transduction histidine kinase